MVFITSVPGFYPHKTEDAVLPFSLATDPIMLRATCRVYGLGFWGNLLAVWSSESVGRVWNSHWLDLHQGNVFEGP